MSRPSRRPHAWLARKPEALLIAAGTWLLAVREGLELGLADELLISVVLIWTRGQKLSGKLADDLQKFRNLRALPISEFRRVLQATGLVTTAGGVSTLLSRLQSGGFTTRISISAADRERLFPAATGWSVLVMLLPKGEEALATISRSIYAKAKRWSDEISTEQSDRIHDQTIAFLRRIKPGTEPQLSQRLADLGFDSHDVIELVEAASEEFDILIPAQSLAMVETVADVIANIRELVAEQQGWMMASGRPK